MSAEGYRIRRLDQSTELIDTNESSKVEPFPVRRWNEPLPIAVEGRAVLHANTEKPEAKSLSRFYPPLLFLSTALTGVFFFLYLTKPVVVESVTPAMGAVVPAVGAAEPSTEAPPMVAEEELSPFPDEMMIPGENLPGLQPLAANSDREAQPAMQSTTLGVEQIVQVESLNGELEEFTVSLPVLYPENMLSWNESSIVEAQRLAEEIELHLEQVRAVQANGVQLLEDWNRLVSGSVPKEVLLDEASLSLSK
ncbi:hypothetical protein [Roseibacillus persicicus]|uniref:hypothetical protein n=1 Tax=Roseibacillus persicicus TaxID=454148 RepID=UPI00280EFB84|nr:hypothetical protein [Roseibacillus persicicus]MDQ8190727.1 hypothetical protein [Roseibacillus persicicus]